ncbi:MAG TPA: sugar phosphorylase, partial [Thermodesulfobacteriota bacterium]|nr:sugar phosphorylase [Thermodesulfobacteriota bacterium]
YNARIRYRAFHPRGEQLVPYLSPDIFVVLRTSPEGNQHILAITNITDHETAAIIPLTTIGVGSSQWFDLLSGRGWEISDERLLIELQPYEVIWLIPADELQ